MFLEERPFSTNGTRAWATYNTSFEFGDSTAQSTNGNGLILFDVDENGNVVRWSNYADLFEFYSSGEQVLLATNAQDDVFLAVHYQDSLRFNGTMHYSNNSFGKKMLLIARMKADGTVQWAKNAGAVDYLLELEATPDRFYLSTSLPDSLSTADSLLGDASVANSLVVLDTLGQLQWRRTTPFCFGCGTAQRFAVYPNGGVIRSDGFYSSQTNQALQTISRFDANGLLLWEQFSNPTGGAIRTDRLIPLPNGGFINSGFYFNTFAWNVGSSVNLPQLAPSMFVAAFDATGSLQWARSAGSSVMSGASVADSNGTIYCHGIVE